jgi:thiamine-phosphate pyrophosphorylase
MILPRFYPILDTQTIARIGIDPVNAAGQIIAGGAKILQLRHKNFFTRESVDILDRIAEMCREAGVTFVVNDRVDLARLVGAGVHLGQEDLLPSLARRIGGNGMTIGFSTHNESQLRAVGGEPADYVALGPIFGTGSKKNPDPVVGLEGLRILRQLTPRPLAAIGGITRENATAVLQAGADSVAVIGDVYPPDGNIRGRVEDWVALVGDA